MKSKGAVKFFAIALAVVCLFQLSFTFIANRIESKADRYASGDPVKKRHYLDSIGREPVFNIGIMKYSYMDIKERQLNLGLDLRGGMHVTLEVAEDKLIRQLSGNNEDPVFNAALNDAKVAKISSQRSFVDLFEEAITKRKPDVHLAAYFATLENKENVKTTSSNEEVIAWLNKEANSALDRTYEILGERIDKFGVTQPNVQIDHTAGRVLVELPGVDDADRVRRLLKSSARLEFYETYTLAEVFPFLQEADNALYAVQEAGKTTGNKKSAADILGADSNTVKADTGKTASNTKTDTSKNSNPLAAFQKKDSGKTAKGDTTKNTNKSTPLLAALFPFQVTNDMAQSPNVGFVKISDTARVDKLLRTPGVADKFPPELKLVWSAKPSPNSDLLELVALRTTGFEDKPAVLYGDVIVDARQDVDRQTNSYIVNMQMNSEGAAEWATITKRNVGKCVAIVLDNQVYSAPRVNNEISGGNSQISGNFTVKEAQDLANILKAGKLPVELNIVDEAIVGPSLGQDAINKGLTSLLVGLIAIIAFMVLYYNRSGWVANLALLVNVFFIIGVLASLNAALTLPGMAGIVLTLAMAVDANVLIYERVREELAHEKGLRLAIADGFRHALSSIIDGNLTTMLIGIILMAFGSGPIYGFAIVLVIGLLTSMFTAILISRLIFDWLLAKDKKINFGNKYTSHLFHGFSFNFVGNRKWGYWFSGITLAIGILSLTINGLNYGVDFEGGHMYQVDFNKPVQVELVRNTLEKTFGSLPEVKTFGSDQRLSITTKYLAKSTTDSSDAIVRAKLEQGLSELPGITHKIVSSQTVSSTIANDIKNSAFWSILLGLAAVFLYIVFRFKRWQFAMGATLALGHDVFFVLSLFSIFRNVMPFSDVDQAVVAALLTIVGYSVNDTVVVFDRIREYLRNNRRSPMVPTVNSAINDTLSRTVITSFTVFVAVAILFFFGGPIIRGFAFAMMVGVAVGTYSSIFVATPIALDFFKKEELQSATM